MYAITVSWTGNLRTNGRDSLGSRFTVLAFGAVILFWSQAACGVPVSQSPLPDGCVEREITELENTRNMFPPLLSSRRLLPSVRAYITLLNAAEPPLAKFIATF